MKEEESRALLTASQSTSTELHVVISQDIAGAVITSCPPNLRWLVMAVKLPQTVEFASEIQYWCYKKLIRLRRLGSYELYYLFF
jgi:hypothetical protein